VPIVAATRKRKESLCADVAVQKEKACKQKGKAVATKKTEAVEVNIILSYFFLFCLYNSFLLPQNMLIVAFMAQLQEIRNRASPSCLFSLNNDLVPKHKIAIIDAKLGSLLNIGKCTMPVDLSQFVMKCYDPVKSTLEVPNRGIIPIDAESVHWIWRLPNSGLKVCYEMKAELIRAINEEYRFSGTNAPDLTAWCNMIRAMNGVADHRFLRAWSVVAFNYFLAPTTRLKVKPRCYPAVNDVSLLPRTKFCQFVVDQIRIAFSTLGNKKSVCCCVFHLMVRKLLSTIFSQFFHILNSLLYLP
jgi:hypothetical protein